MEIAVEAAWVMDGPTPSPSTRYLVLGTSINLELDFCYDKTIQRADLVQLKCAQGRRAMLAPSPL